MIASDIEVTSFGENRGVGRPTLKCVPMTVPALHIRYAHYAKYVLPYSAFYWQILNLAIWRFGKELSIKNPPI